MCHFSRKYRRIILLISMGVFLFAGRGIMAAKPESDCILPSGKSSESKEGFTNEVLAPWTPIAVDKRADCLRIGVWGRTYEFGTMPFPAKIATKDKEILVQPIHVSAKAEGKDRVC